MTLPRAPFFQLFKSRNGWRWRLRAGNGRIVANGGESFSSRAKCRHSMLDAVNLANAAWWSVRIVQSKKKAA